MTDDLEAEYSARASMGLRGVGSNPEELLVCASLLGHPLRLAPSRGLPAASLPIAATGTVGRSRRRRASSG